MKKIVIGTLCVSSLLFSFDEVFLDALYLPTDVMPSRQTPIRSVNYHIMPYAEYLSYSGETTKDIGSIGGVYISNIARTYKTEIDIKYTNISIKNDTDYKQAEFSLLLNYIPYQINYIMGMHYIKNNTEYTDNGIVLITGVIKTTNSYKYGSYLYYSNYSNANDTSPDFIQLSPQIGFNIGNSPYVWNRFYVEARFDYTKTLINKDENDLKSSYSSGELSFSAYNGPFSTSAGVWFGKRNFIVRNKGLVVDNINQNQTGGVKIAENYQIDKFSSITLGYEYTNFDDSKSELSNILLSYDQKF